MPLLDVTSEDVRRLSDDDLAELLGRLIEAEAAANGIPLSTVTHGGHGNARDGGLDARVSWSGGPGRTDFFPRRTTGLQSKAETMTAARLSREMAPSGHPRALFRELADDHGAYVIFCGKDNCTDAMLRERKRAMRSAVSCVTDNNYLALDFYDASRIARWSNLYTGVAIWLRDKLGRPLCGWRPYEPWSRLDKTEELPYLTDETCRAAFTSAESAPEVSISDALTRVRSLLAEGGRSVRLVGLSGTGKTRFAEALFDNNAGDSALPPSRVIYGDVGSAEVSPASVAELLIARKRPAIMIADNCRAHVHRDVTNSISRPDSQVSFLSIDYDVGEDQPESTQVVRLREDSDEIIRNILLQRAPNLSLSDQDRIVDFSGGNSRVALVLVRSTQNKGSLANLTDRELIRRLFQGDRQPASGTLMRCAEVASLVVSYSVTSHEEGATPEYHHLAPLAEVSPQEMHRATREFLDLGVAQQRGPWRAILPHALAARLARQALASIPRRQLYETFTQQASRRLSLSFAKRLGQIDDHPEAQALAEMLLAPDGPIGVVSADDRYGLEMLQALAPAAEEAALDTIDRSLDADEVGSLLADRSEDRFWIAKLLMHLAYEPAQFDRAATLLTRIVKDESKDNNVNNVRHFFEQLFWVMMSGTLADPDQRMDFVEELLASNDEATRSLGMDALDAALKMSMFSSNADLPKFGGSARSWGWYPQTDEQVEQQFARPARRLIAIAVSKGRFAERARSALAQHVRQLSSNRFIHLVEECARTIRAQGFWAAGWCSMCHALHFDGRDIEDEAHDRVVELERMLAPETLAERFETFVLQPYWEIYTPDPKHEDDHYVDFQSEIDRISQDLKDAPDQLREFVERTMHSEHGQIVEFGMSFVDAGFGADHLYSLGIRSWEACNSQRRNFGFLLGILKGLAESDPDKAEEMLDQIAHDQSLGRELVRFSRVVTPPNSRTLVRILSALRAGHIEPGSLVGLAIGASRHELPQAELAALLEALTARGRDGNAAAAKILFDLQRGEAHSIGELSPELLAIARRVVESEQFFSSSDIMRTYVAKGLAKAVLEHERDPQLASAIAAGVLAAIEQGAYGDESHRDVMRFIASRFPDVFLSEFIVCTGKNRAIWYFDADSSVRRSAHPIDCVSPDCLMEWVSHDPGTRARRVAQMLTFATNGSDGSAEGTIWTPAALDLIGIEETAADVLSEFENRFYRSWSGSEAHWYARRRPLCEALRNHSNPAVNRWSREALRRMEHEIRKAEERERRDNQSFE